MLEASKLSELWGVVVSGQWVMGWGLGREAGTVLVREWAHWGVRVPYDPPENTGS